MRTLLNTSLLCLLLSLPPFPAASAEALATLKTMPVHTLLNANLNQRVTLLMRSGRDITGTVSSVGTSTVHLRAIRGKEFYDAVVNVDDVEAVMARVRDR